MTKKIIIGIIIFINIFCINVYAYTTVTNDDLLESSDFDYMQLNITSFPDLKVIGTSDYNIVSDTSRRLNISNSISDYDLFNNVKIIATFNNCGTLNGNDINMVVTYSGLIRGTWSGTRYLGWTAYGKSGLETEGGNQKSANEWWNAGFSDFKVEISFYYTKKNKNENINPIGFNNVYMTFYSLDGNTSPNDRKEGVSSDSPYLNRENGGDGVILFDPTCIRTQKNDTSYSTATMYFGTVSRGSAGGPLDAVSFNWKAKGSDKVKSLSFYEHIRNGTFSHGYHLNFGSIVGTKPPVVNNEVDDFKLALTNGQIISNNEISNGTTEGVMELDDIKYM